MKVRCHRSYAEVTCIAVALVAFLCHVGNAAEGNWTVGVSGGLGVPTGKFSSDLETNPGFTVSAEVGYMPQSTTIFYLRSGSGFFPLKEDSSYYYHPTHVGVGFCYMPNGYGNSGSNIWVTLGFAKLNGEYLDSDTGLAFEGGFGWVVPIRDYVSLYPSLSYFYHKASIVGYSLGSVEFLRAGVGLAFDITKYLGD